MIIIPIRDSVRSVVECLASIERQVPRHIALCIVDDGSGPETQRMLQAHARQADRRVHLLRHEASRGFAHAVNAGLGQAAGNAAETALVLNSDTVIIGDAVTRLMHALAKEERLAAVGPLSNAAGMQSIPSSRPTLGDRLLLRTVKNDASPQAFEAAIRSGARTSTRAMTHEPSPVRVQRLHGFAMALKVKAVREVGLLDAVAFPTGHGVETDLSMRLRVAGYELAVAPDAFIWHARSGSTSDRYRIRGVLHGRRTLRRRYGPASLQAVDEATRRALALPELRQSLAARLTVPDATDAGGGSASVSAQPTHG